MPRMHSERALTMQHYLRSVHRYALHRAGPSSRLSHLRQISDIPRVRPRARLTPTTLFIGFIPIFTFALGTWQVKRLRWKLDLIDKVEDQAHRPPVELPENFNTDALSDVAYRKFLVKGKWDHSHSILVGPRTRDGVNGYHVVTPLVREGGSIVLVDRGFVSKEVITSSRNLQALDQPQGEVEVQGMLRPPVRKNIFTPNNNPEQGEWYWLDVDGIKEWAGGDEGGVQNLIIEQLFEGYSMEAAELISRGVPVGRSSDIELRNMHATYALTWYSLSFATGLMFFRLLRRPHPFVSRLGVR